jgi:hypothetical protein
MSPVVPVCNSAGIPVLFVPLTLSPKSGEAKSIVMGNLRKKRKKKISKHKRRKQLRLNRHKNK